VLQPNGQLQVFSPPGKPVTAIKMLEAAIDAVKNQELQREQQPAVQVHNGADLGLVEKMRQRG
jgi:hypothetical protein